MIASDKITRADFAAHLDETFELITGTGGIDLTLVETRPTGKRHGTAREPFALKFQGAPYLRLPEANYPLQNTALGAMEIHLVQVGADHAGSYFEAVFN